MNIPKINWNDDNTISVAPPKRPKKCTGTRFAAVLGLNPWCTPFEAWCAITRTYEKPFEDTIYTKAGKIIEPKQAEYMREKYFWRKLVTPTDVFGENYFRKTYGDFFHNQNVFGGMWDYLFVDDNGNPVSVMEMKTTKRAEDWLREPPEYYALQAALYAYLLGIDEVYMVCTILEDDDYEHPEYFKVSDENTFTYEFKISERYLNFQDMIDTVIRWWVAHVENGLSPAYNEKKDADILKELRKNTLNPNSDINALCEEAELLQKKIDDISKSVKADSERLKTLKDLIKKSTTEQFREGDQEVVIHGTHLDWVTSKSVTYKIDEKAMENDGILDKYKTKKTVMYKLTAKERKI